MSNSKKSLFYKKFAVIEYKKEYKSIREKVFNDPLFNDHVKEVSILLNIKQNIVEKVIKFHLTQYFIFFKYMDKVNFKKVNFKYFHVLLKSYILPFIKKESKKTNN